MSRYSKVIARTDTQTGQYENNLPAYEGGNNTVQSFMTQLASFLKASDDRKRKSLVITNAI